MNKPSSNESDMKKLREKVIGLGERSYRKSYYPQLLQQIEALEAEHRKAVESEWKFRTLFEHISDGIVLTDMETRAFRLVNHAASELLGYSIEELQNLNYMDILSVEDLPWIIGQFERQLRGEIKIVRDVPLKRKDGSVVFVDVNATLVSLDERELLMGVVRDVTERREAESALESAYLDTVLALSRVLDARDAYTGNHSQNLASWARAIAENMGCSQTEIRTIHWAALLHDIGKIGVPDEILRKPGPLTVDEWNALKPHPEIGAAIVAPIKRLKGVAEVIRAHHEKFDGTGYPDGLKGADIPLGGRILAVADAYGAMTDERIYRGGLSREAAVVELKTHAGSQFDPEIVKIFLQVLGEENQKDA